jgi:capsular polysaccharide biosynthesis protein
MIRTLIRRGWLVPLITVAVAAIAYLIAHNQSRTYTSKATLVVPSGVKTAAGPETPSDATDQARTYAAQIPEDDRVVGAIAQGLHASARGVRDSLTADAVVGANPGSDTALVTISYAAGSAAKAQSGARLAASAVTGPQPAATGVIPGTLELVRAPDTGTSSSLGTTAITIGGGIVGFALALLLLITWERADRRINRPEDLAEEANCPATRLRDLSSDARAALLRRWGDFGSGGSAEVALMAVDGRTLHRLSPSHLWPLVPQRSDASNGHGNGKRHHNGSPSRIPLDDGVVLTTPLSPADDPASQETAMEADVAILVARRGAPAARVRKTVQSLDEMGTPPRWALLLG